MATAFGRFTTDWGLINEALVTSSSMTDDSRARDQFEVFSDEFGQIHRLATMPHNTRLGE